VSLQFRPGEFVGVLGRSGAGKSTLLRMINRLTEPTSGTIHMDGLELTSLKNGSLRAWRRRCAMIFQQPRGHRPRRLDRPRGDGAAGRDDRRRRGAGARWSRATCRISP
jgi:ABC-type glutathione transport system ATPase component